MLYRSGRHRSSFQLRHSQTKINIPLFTGSKFSSQIFVFQSINAGKTFDELLFINKQADWWDIRHHKRGGEVCEAKPLLHVSTGTTTGRDSPLPLAGTNCNTRWLEPITRSRCLAGIRGVRFGESGSPSRAELDPLKARS